MSRLITSGFPVDLQKIRFGIRLDGSIAMVVNGQELYMMEKRITSLIILTVVLCMFGWACNSDNSTPTQDGEGAIIERDELDTSVGEKWRFSFSETSDDSDEGNEFGIYEYEIYEVNEVEGTKI